MEFVSSGSGFVDNFLGGLGKNQINMVYGEAATGKTTLCLIFCAEMASQGKKVIFLDSENGFSVERLSQISGKNIMEFIDNIFVIKLKDFEEQKKKISLLKDFVERGKFDAIIFDTMGYHYRKALKDAPPRVNKDADNQFKILKELADDGKIVLVTNKVYANFKERDRVEIVGGQMFKNWSGVLVELRKLEENIRKMVIFKPFEKEKKFKIINEGFTAL